MGVFFRVTETDMAQTTPRIDNVLELDEFNQGWHDALANDPVLGYKATSEAVPEIDSITYTPPPMTAIPGKAAAEAVASTEPVTSIPSTNFDDLTFSQAFDVSRKSGEKTFPWRGNLYTTDMAEDENTIQKPTKTKSKSATELPEASSGFGLLDMLRQSGYTVPEDQSILTTRGSNQVNRLLNQPPSVDTLKKGARTPLTDEEYAKVKTAWELATPSKRAIMEAQPDAAGYAASEVGSEYRAADTSGGIGKEDMRLENRTRHWIDKGATPENARLAARREILGGIQDPDLQPSLTSGDQFTPLPRSEKIDVNQTHPNVDPAYVEAHPYLSSLESGAAQYAQSFIDMPQWAADQTNATVVNPFLRAFGLPDLPNAPRLKTAVALSELAQQTKPKLTETSVAKAYEDGQLMPWIGMQALLQAPQVAMSVAALPQSLRSASLALMGASSGSLQYQQDLDKNIRQDRALADSAVNAGFEILGELLPLDVFDHVKKYVKTLPPMDQTNFMREALKRVGYGTAAIASQRAADAGGEMFTQVGQNASQRFIAGNKNQGLTDSVPEAGVIGAVVGAPQSILLGKHTVDAMKNSQAQMIDAIRSQIRNTEFREPSDAEIMSLLGTHQSGFALPKATLPPVGPLSRAVDAAVPTQPTASPSTPVVTPDLTPFPNGLPEATPEPASAVEQAFAQANQNPAPDQPNPVAEAIAQDQQRQTAPEAAPAVTPQFGPDAYQDDMTDDEVLAALHRAHDPQAAPEVPAAAPRAQTVTAPPQGEASPNEFDVSGRTDAQLEYLATNGKPGFKEAATKELARRRSATPPQGDQNGLQNQGQKAAEEVIPSLLDEQGRTLFPIHPVVRSFKQATGLGQDGIRAIQEAQLDGRPITLAEARKIDTEALAQRKRAFEESQTPEAKKADFDAIAAQEAAKQKEREDYVANNGGVPQPGYYQFDDEDEPSVKVENGIVFRLNKDGEWEPKGVVTPGKTDQAGVALVSYIAHGTEYTLPDGSKGISRMSRVKDIGESEANNPPPDRVDSQIRDGDLTNTIGKPFTTRGGAVGRIYRDKLHDTHDVVRLEDGKGFVVRPLPETTAAPEMAPFGATPEMAPLGLGANEGAGEGGQPGAGRGVTVNIGQPEHETTVNNTVENIVQNEQRQEGKLFTPQQRNLAHLDLIERALGRSTDPAWVSAFQWQRNAEGGQDYGNQQLIAPLTPESFDRYVAPRVREDLRDFTQYRAQYPDVTHLSVVSKDKGNTWQLDGAGTAAELAPKPDVKSWVMPVASLASEQAIQKGLTADSDVVVQNRDRSSPSSIAQMQSISANPDYGRLGFSRDFANGAPVVSGSDIPADQIGKSDVAVAGNGRRIPVQYAVVEADKLLPSNTINGTPIADYDNPPPGMAKVIAGNGRIAGLQSAYQQKNAGGYRAELETDPLHGVSPSVIRAMRNPVLVRVMPEAEITPDIGDLSNTTANLELSPVEQAKNDARRVNLDDLEFGDDGSITPQTVRRFVQAMPQAEQGGLLDTNGQPTKQAVDRLNNAVFATAYNNDALIRLYAQAQDPEARNILSALAQVAPKMARLEGAGALDIRPVITQAAEIAVNAKRDGRTLQQAADQMDIATHPDTGVVLDLFARNARTVKPVVESLSDAADFAYTESLKPAEDMFGAVPRASRADIIDLLRPENERGRQENLENPARRQPVANHAVGPEAGRNQPAGQGHPGTPQAGGPAANPEAREGFGLTGQTEAEIRAEEARQAKALADAEAERKKVEDEARQARIAQEIAARQEGSAKDFHLGQDAENALAGQGDLMNNTPAQANPNKPQSTAPEHQNVGVDGREAKAQIEQGRVGMKLAGGQVVLTSSGRETTPFPRIDTETNRKTGRTIERVNNWLMSNALAEAQSRGDQFNERQFQATNWLNPSQSDKDAAEEYLFGQQPEVVPSILKPLVPKTEETVPSTPKEGTILFNQHGEDYRIDGSDGGRVKLTKNRGKLSEQIIMMDKGTFARLVKEDAEYRAEMAKPSAAAKPAVSQNTVFTEDAAAKARALLKAKLGQLNSGIDPELMQAGITLAGYHIEKGARTFAAYAKAMIADLGDAVRPYLKSWYMGVKYDPRASGFDGMDDAATVESSTDHEVKETSTGQWPSDIQTGDSLDVTAYRARKFGSTDSSASKYGVFYADSAEGTSGYGGSASEVIEERVKANNVLVAESKRDAIQQLFGKNSDQEASYFDARENEEQDAERVADEMIAPEALAQGYDAVVYPNDTDLYGNPTRSIHYLGGIKQEAKAEPVATAHDLHTPEGKFKVAQTLADDFIGGAKFNTIIEARKRIADLIKTKIEPATELAKQADETIEVAVVLAAREIVKAGRRQGRSPQMIYDRLLSLYNAQPNLAVRSSTSVRDQAYSTPVPLAFVASELAGVTYDTKLLEPTAGNGMLAIGAATQNTHANELNPDRAAMLMELGFNTKSVNAATETLAPPRSQDAVVANPPFGVVKDANGETVVYKVLPIYDTRELDHAIAFKALEAMKDDGKAVLIVGGSNARSEEGRRDDYRGKNKRAFYYQLYRQYNVTDHFTVDGAMYAKQGASYPVDVIVINGRGQASRDLPAADLPQIIGSYDELKEKLNETRSVGTARNGGTAGVGSGEVATGAGNGTAVVGGTGRPGSGIGREGGQVSNPDGLSSPGRSGAGGIESGGSVSGSAQSQPANMAESGNAGTQPVSGQSDGAGPGRPVRARNRPEQLGGERLISGERVESGLNDRRGEEQETESQVTYAPHSGAPSVGTLVPRAMRDSIDASLQKIEDQVGDLDNYVSERLSMDADTVRSNFSAEQVDALALAIKNAEEGRGFIIGDQTGIGKGRVVAAMIRYALVNDKIPIFITEKPNLYADMIRDLDDIGMTDELALDTQKPRILITNGGEKIPYSLVRESNGEVTETQFLLKAPKSGKALDDAFNRMMDANNLGEYKVIFTTYSQLQTVKGKVTDRMKFVQQFGSGNYIIFDESHNAGGAGETDNPRNAATAVQQAISAVAPGGRAGFARSLVNSAYGTFFSSATYAKRPDVMDLYSSTNMKLAVDRIADLSSAIKEGGVPMQQVVANMLTMDGQYIRRERTFAGVSYDTVETKVDKQTAENMASAMRSILAFSRAKESAIKKIQEDMDKEGETIQQQGGERVTIQGANFGSIMHNLIDQMLLSLKAMDSVGHAIKRLKAGEKVVLTVSNTMGSFIKDYAEEMGLNNGDPVALSFADLYARYLEKQRMVTIKDANGNKTKRRLTDQELGTALTSMFETIRNYIMGAGFGSAPISPIDFMHSELRKAGYKTDEITGRTNTINYAGGTPILTSRSADIRQRVNAVRGFNNGDIDVIILNQAGATGLSLHASSKVKDKSKRHMIIAQAEKNIDTHMQMLGRVHRTGQVIAPSYSQMMADVPAEMRPAAVLLKKMASLNANTTASRKSSVTAEGVVDFMNDYGGQVAQEFLRDNPDIHNAIGGPDVIALIDDTTKASEDHIRKFTGYVPILPIQQQEDIYSDLIERYNELLERENTLGTNKLEAKAIDLDAETLGTQQITEDKGDPSIFASPANMERVDVKRLVEPYSSEEVAKQIQDRLGDKSSDEVTKEQLVNLKERASAFINDRIAKMQAAEDANHVKIEAQRNLLNMVYSNTRTVLETYKIGYPVSIKDDLTSQIVYGVITSIHSAGRTANPAAGSDWKMNIALANGDAKSITLTFSQIGGRYILAVEHKTQWFNPETQNSELTPVMSIFDKGVNARRENRWMVTGNILAGFSKYPGQIITYTKKDGLTGQGVLLSRTFDFNAEKNNQPVNMKTGANAVKFMEKYYGTVGTADRTLHIIRSGGNYRITVPSSKKDGGTYYLDKQLTDILRTDFYRRGSLMSATVSNDEIVKRAVDYIIQNRGEPIFAVNALDKAREVMGIGKDQPIAGTKLSRGDAVTDGMARRDLQAVVDRIAQAYKNLPRIHVLESPAELSTREKTQKALRDYIRKHDAWNDVEGAFHDGEIYLFANGLSDEARAEFVLAQHEITHYGLRGLLGKQMDVALQRVFMSNPDIHRKTLAAKQRLGLESNLEAVEEVLADTPTEELVKLKNWRRLVQVVRDGLSRLGFKRTAALLDRLMKAGLSEQAKADAYVSDLIRAARNWARDGKGGAGTAFMSGTRLSQNSENPNITAGRPHQTDTINVDGVDRPTTNSKGQLIHPTKEGLMKFWRWFGDSIVVDDQGRPLVVYHGTPADISEFNRVFLGNNTGAKSARKGFFFAKDAITASSPYYTGFPMDLFDSAVIDPIRKRVADELGITVFDTLYSPVAGHLIQKYISDPNGGREAEIKKELHRLTPSLFNKRAPLSVNEIEQRGKLRAELKEIEANREYLSQAGHVAAHKYRADEDGNYVFDDEDVYPNVMAVYLRITNPVTHDFGGSGYRDTSYAELLSTAGETNDGAIFTNTSDGAGITDIYVAFDPTQIKSAIGNNGEFNPDNANILRESGADYGTWYYSPLARAMEQMPAKLDGAKAPLVKTWLIANAGKLGVKKDELQWSGVTDWLDLQGKAGVSKQAILDYLREGGVKVEEVELNDTTETIEKLENEAWQLQFIVRAKEDAVRTLEHQTDAVYPRGVQEAARSKLPSAHAELEAAIAQHDKKSNEATQAKNMPRTKFSAYQLPGGENYRELLLKLPSVPPPEQIPTPEIKDRGIDENGRPQFDVVYNGEVIDSFNNWARAQDFAYEYAQEWQKNKPATFTHYHFDQPNILAHVRFNERTDADGQRVLFIEEIQSDWGQQGRKEGFAEQVPLTVRRSTDAEADEDTFEIMRGNTVIGYTHSPNETLALENANSRFSGSMLTKGTPSAPFVHDTKAWTALALKRMISYAAEHGFDRVAWTTGAQQAERYDLSKHIDSIGYERRAPDLFNISVWGKSDIPVWQSQSATLSEIEDHIGKEMAQKIASGAGRVDGKLRYLEDLDLKVGGSGMIGYYDGIVTQVANDILKKLGGGKVGSVTLQGTRSRDELAASIYGAGETYRNLPSEQKRKIDSVFNDRALEQPGFDITPKMRAEAAQGLSLFEPKQVYTKKNAPKGDPYANLATRDGTQPEQLRTGRAALAELERSIFMRGTRATLLGSAISRDFRANGAISLVGQTVQSGRDLAVLSQVLRDPRFETFRVFFVDDAGKIIGERAYTSRMSGFVMFPTDFSGVINNDRQRIGASGYWMLHNHPSGRAKESDADNVMTLHTSRNSPGFKGHVIIDHDEFNVLSLDADGNVATQLTSAPELNATDFRANPEVPHPYLGEVIDGPHRLAQIGKALQKPGDYATLIGTDAKGRISAIFEIPDSSLRTPGTKPQQIRLLAQLKQATRETGSTRIFAVVPGKLAYYGKLLDAGIFTDVFDVNGNHAVTTRPVGSIPSSKVEWRGGKMAVASPPTQYNAPLPGTQGFQQTPPNGGVSAYEAPEESLFRGSQRVLQDQMNRWNVVQQDLARTGMTPDLTHTGRDVWNAERRMHGKVAAQVEDFRERTVKPLIKRIHEAGFNLGEVAEFLQAQHAPERNAAIAKINDLAVDENGNPNGSGMTDAEARAIMARHTDPEFIKLANEFRGITDATLRILLQAGIVSPDQAAAWRKAYQHYVPLRGSDEDQGNGNATGKGNSVNAKREKKRALGHQARDEFVLENILYAHERAILLAEKNEVFKHLLRLAMSVQAPNLWTVGKPQKRAVLKPGTASYGVYYKGNAIASFDTKAEAEKFRHHMAYSAGPYNNSNLVISKSYSDPQVAYMASPLPDKNEVIGYIKGEQVRIQLHDDLLLRAYQKLGQENLNWALRAGREINTYLSKAYTGLNPEFILTNMQRDLISGLINITGEQGGTMALRTLANWLPSLRAMLSYSVRGKDNLWIEYYRKDGGSTGAAYLSDLERIGRSTQRAFEESVGVKRLAKEYKGAALRVGTKKLIHLAAGWIEHLNAAAENGMRVAIYRSMVERAAKDQGIDVNALLQQPGGEQKLRQFLENQKALRLRNAAAQAAKDSTVNFNAKGEYGAQLGALYLFANPAIQGSASMAHALFMGKHKGQAWAAMGSLAALAFMLAAQFDDDEWDEIPQYEKDRSMLFKLWNGTRVKIAVPYGHGVAFALGNAIYDMSRGKKDVSEQAYHMASSLLENMSPINPLGDKPDPVYAATQIIPFEPLKLIVQAATNKNNFQSPIRPESKFDEAQPDFLKMHRATHGSVYEQITTGLNTLTGGTLTQAGWADMSPETLRFLVESAIGGSGKFFVDTVALSNKTRHGLEEGADLTQLVELYDIPMVRKGLSEENPTNARRAFWESWTRLNNQLENVRRAEHGNDLEALEGMRPSDALADTVNVARETAQLMRDAIDQTRFDDSIPPARKALMIKNMEKADQQQYRDMRKMLDNLLDNP